MPPVAAAVAVWGVGAAGGFGAITASFGIAGTIIAGAVVGAVGGGATAALMGEDIGKGALMGALAGGTSSGIFGATGQIAAKTTAGVAEAGVGSAGNAATNTGTSLLSKTPTSFWEAGAGLGGGTAPQATAPGIIGQTGGQVAQQATSGVSPEVMKMIDANLEASKSATKWQMIGNAASAGLESYMAEDPDDTRKGELDTQLELEKSRKIKLSPTFGEGLASPKRFVMTPFEERLAKKTKLNEVPR